MFVDASALIAIIAREADADSLAARLDQARRVHTSPIAVFEAVLGLARIGATTIAEAETTLLRFLDRFEVEILPITAEVCGTALAAFERYGKGRHAAQLNIGDCFAYACARNLGAPLLFKGDDFPQTDIEVA